MDPLLKRKHPRLFRERIEVHELGPFRIRRPIVRACFLVVAAAVLALAALAAGFPAAAEWLGALAVAALLPVWAKWHFVPTRLPVVLVVPFVLVAAYARGWLRARRLEGARPAVRLASPASARTGGSTPGPRPERSRHSAPGP
jgi:hypothetical protein